MNKKKRSKVDSIWALMFIFWGSALRIQDATEKELRTYINEQAKVINSLRNRKDKWKRQYKKLKHQKKNNKARTRDENANKAKKRQDREPEW